MKVYKSINAIQSALAKTGISKDQKNMSQGFRFRGIDDVLNALSPLLAEHQLCILPKVISREVTERATARGGILFSVMLMVEFSFVSSEDGSSHLVTICGEAMDSGDKATNKALSAAYKYACLQAFCIPTEGDNDADAQTHEVVADPVVKAKPVVSTAVSELITKIKKSSNPRENANKVIGWYGVKKIGELTEEQATTALSKMNEGQTE